MCAVSEEFKNANVNAKNAMIEREREVMVYLDAQGTFMRSRGIETKKVTVRMSKKDVQVGCHRIEVDALRRLLALHDEYFNEAPEVITIQEGL